jgi:hypothetical protein
MTKWLFLTAALGAPEIREAAERLKSQVQKLDLFAECVVFDEAVLLSIEPDYIDKFAANQQFNSRGFGYYAWKPILAKTALSNHWGKFDGICYMDAGCELLPNYRAKKQFQNYLLKSTKKGYTFFSTFKPELSYTKKHLLDQFPELQINAASEQIMSGFWFMSSDFGLIFTDLWEMYASELINIDDTISSCEVDQFVEHRHDQSVFSMVAKKLKADSEILGLRGLEKGPKKLFFAWIGPVRLARNKTQKSDISDIFHILANLNLKIFSALKKQRL